MIVRRFRRDGLGAVVLAAVVVLGACGDGGRSDDVPETGGGAVSTASQEEVEVAAPEPAGDDAATGAIELSHARWYARDDSAGDIGVRYFALVENTSDAVLEVAVEVEAIDAEGEAIGRSGPQPFLDFISPGERLPVGLAGRLRDEPADVIPVVEEMDLADFEQERYGHMRFAGDVRQIDVGVDEIFVEVTSTGDRPGQSLFYLAAFDAAGEIVAAGVGGWISSEIGVGESLVLEGSLSRDPMVHIDVDRVEIFFPAAASVDAG